MEKDFSHLTTEGVHMVEVGDKDVVKRTAIARGRIYLQKSTIELIMNQKVKKGNVLTTSQIAAIQAVKETSHIIPLCHPLQITGVDVEFQVDEDFIEAQVEVKINGKTGVEMEALTGVSIALLTIWDMVKSVEKDDAGQYPQTRISDIKVVKKLKESI